MSGKDKTFVAFTAEQAAQYAAGRGMSYPAQLYQTILDYHKGERNLLLDVGTGPGKVVFDLAPFFKQAIGSDPSVQMIEYAKKEAVTHGWAEKTRFVVGSGEECAKALTETKEGSVDLLTVAMAAHWLDMPAFYASAAKALGPGGTLAMWTFSSLYCHPSMPNAKAIQEILSDLEDRMLAPYQTPSTALTRHAYESLPLPWTSEPPEPGFEKSSFVRKDWDLHGIPSSPPNADGTPGPFWVHRADSLSFLEKGLGSASQVIKWRQANPDKAQTEEDPVVITMRKLKQLAGERESLVLSPSTSVLLMRKVL